MILKRIRYIVRDLSLIVSYVAGAIACAGIAKAVWLIIWSLTEKANK